VLIRQFPVNLTAMLFATDEPSFSVETKRPLQAATVDFASPARRRTVVAMLRRWLGLVAAAFCSRASPRRAPSRGAAAQGHVTDLPHAHRSAIQTLRRGCAISSAAKAARSRC